MTDILSLGHCSANLNKPQCWGKPQRHELKYQRDLAWQVHVFFRANVLSLTRPRDFLDEIQVECARVG